MAKDTEAGRYREAAERILEQLDSAINYLYRIHKDGIAAALARNRDAIRSRIRNPPPTLRR